MIEHKTILLEVDVPAELHVTDANFIRDYASDFECEVRLLESRTPPAQVPDTVRKRMDEIERAIASSEMEAPAVFTQMAQLVRPATPPDAPFGYTGIANSELARLRAIEHHVWHLLDDSMREDAPGGETVTVSGGSNIDLTALYELLPEDHPEVAAAPSAPQFTPEQIDEAMRKGAEMGAFLRAHDSPGTIVTGLAAPQQGDSPYQQRVAAWMLDCFTPEIAADRAERNHRFLEEALELVQSLDCTGAEAHQLVDYVCQPAAYMRSFKDDTPGSRLSWEFSSKDLAGVAGWEPLYRAPQDRPAADRVAVPSDDIAVPPGRLRNAIGLLESIGKGEPVDADVVQWSKEAAEYLSSLLSGGA